MVRHVGSSSGNCESCGDVSQHNEVQAAQWESTIDTSIQTILHIHRVTLQEPYRRSLLAAMT